MEHDECLELVSPVAPAPDPGEQLAGHRGVEPWSGFARARVSLVDNGKANALELLEALQESLIAGYGAIRGITVHKEVSGPIHNDDLAELAAASDLVLVGSAD